MKHLPHKEGTLDSTLANIIEEWLKLLSRLSVSVSTTERFNDKVQASDMTQMSAKRLDKSGGAPGLHCQLA